LDGRAAELAERPVRRGCKVGQRVGECSVEIEEHGANSRLHAGTLPDGTEVGLLLLLPEVFS